MKQGFWLIISAFLLIIAQGIIDNYLNISIYLSIALLPFIILMLPYKLNIIWTMLIAFAIGLTTDLAGNGILGISSAALTAAAACRTWILNISIDKEILNKEKYPSPATVKIPNFILYAGIFIVIYLTVYIAADNAGFTPFGPFVLRFFISLVINLMLMTLLFIITKERRQ